MIRFIKNASQTMLAMIIAGAVIAVSLILVLVLGVLGVYGNGWFTDHTANRQGQTQKEHQVEGNGAYRIAAYDHFFDLCQQVQVKEASIGNVLDELKTTTDPQRVIVLNASITALRNSRVDLITQYNTDSDKSYTVGQFKSSNLPYELTVSQENTVCHA